MPIQVVIGPVFGLFAAITPYRSKTYKDFDLFWLKPSQGVDMRKDLADTNSMEINPTNDPASFARLANDAMGHEDVLYRFGSSDEFVSPAGTVLNSNELREAISFLDELLDEQDRQAEAVAQDYPARFNSREEWVAYNKQCVQYDSERAALKGGSYHEYHELMCEKQRADSRDRLARFGR